MRLIPSALTVLAILASLNGCGTKTPLSLPPQAQPATQGAAPPAPAVDNSNKAAAEQRQ